MAATSSSSLSYWQLLWGTVAHPVDTIGAIVTGGSPDWQLQAIKDQAAQDIAQAGGSPQDIAQAGNLISQAFAQGNAQAQQDWADKLKSIVSVIEILVVVAIILYALGLGLRYKEEFFPS